MLQQLHIENFALIDRLSLEFGSGLNLLTGETGSGKSIVVDALDVLLGGRASPEMIRAGSDRAVLLGVFHTSNAREFRRAVESFGIDLEDGELLVRREVQSSGRTRVFLNDRPATLGALRELAPWLADIHGQNEHTAIAHAGAQLEMLDRFSGSEELAEQVADAHRAWRQAGARLSELTHNEQEKLRLADLWAFQKQEIASASPAPGEDEQLNQEKRVLANSGRIAALVQAAYDAIYDGPQAALGSMATALKSVEEVARIDPALESICDALRGARIAAEDASLSLRDYLENIESNPQRLDEVEDRLAVLDRLKRKYGPSLDDVRTHLEKVTRQLDELESSDELARKARQELDAAAERYRELASELSARRKSAAARLEKAVVANLKELAMDDTVVSFEFGKRARVPSDAADGQSNAEEPSATGTDGWKANGIDEVQLLISPNPGEPLRPVEQIASGGELSRLMLALKVAVETSRDRLPGTKRRQGDPERARTLVFDEIDAGIGGRVSESVGRKLKALAATHQVLCVTHLAQIASFADSHYFVEKIERDARTVTLAKALAESERATELARMMAGARVTDAVMKHARELLKSAKAGN